MISYGHDKFGIREHKQTAATLEKDTMISQAMTGYNNWAPFMMGKEVLQRGGWRKRIWVIKGYSNDLKLWLSGQTRRSLSPTEASVTHSQPIPFTPSFEVMFYFKVIFDVNDSKYNYMNHNFLSPQIKSMVSFVTMATGQIFDVTYLNNYMNHKFLSSQIKKRKSMASFVTMATLGIVLGGTRLKGQDGR